MIINTFKLNTMLEKIKDLANKENAELITNSEFMNLIHPVNHIINNIKSVVNSKVFLT